MGFEEDNRLKTINKNSRDNNRLTNCLMNSKILE